MLGAQGMGARGAVSTSGLAWPHCQLSNLPPHHLSAQVLPLTTDMANLKTVIVTGHFNYSALWKSNCRSAAPDQQGFQPHASVPGPQPALTQWELHTASDHQESRPARTVTAAAMNGTAKEKVFLDLLS